jgi:hypothetical protein
MGLTFKTVPKGFERAGATPLEDLIAKFIGVKLVVDPGTAQEQTYVFTNADDVGMIEENGFDVVNTVTMGTLEPLSVGRHVVDAYFSMSAMHCDGLGRVVEENCLLAGDSFYVQITFEVTAGHN